MIAPALKPTKRLTPPRKTCTWESHEGLGVNSLIAFSRPTVAVSFCVTSLGIVQLKQTPLLTFWAYQRVSCHRTGLYEAWEICQKAPYQLVVRWRPVHLLPLIQLLCISMFFVWRYEIRSLCGVPRKEGRTEWRRLAYWRSYAASSQYQSYGGENSEVSLKMSRFQATNAVCRWDCMILLFVHALLHQKQLHPSISLPWWHCFKCSCKVLQIWGFFSLEFIWLHDSCLWKRARNLHLRKVYSRRQWSATGSSNESCFETLKIPTLRANTSHQNGQPWTTCCALDALDRIDFSDVLFWLCISNVIECYWSMICIKHQGDVQGKHCFFSLNQTLDGETTTCYKWERLG